ncbi:MAG: SGNH/GDSL hydrolase family protein [Gemmatimonadaceae bacterium]
MKRLLWLAALLVCSGLLALLLAEGLLRALHLAPTDGLTTVSRTEFLHIPGMLAPGSQFIDLRNENLPHRVSIDSLGYRGQEFPREKQAHEVRIVMIGDSFVYGDFVDDSASLPAQLERELRRTCPGSRVINAGIPGTTVTEHEHVVTRALSLHPDLVILAFTENDVSDLASRPQWDILDEHRRAKATFPTNVLYPLLHRTALWNLAMQVRGRLRTEGHADAASRQVTTAGRAGVVPDSALRAFYEREFTVIATVLAQKHVPLDLLTFPAHLTLYGSWSTEQLEWVEAMSLRHDVPVLATLPALRADGGDERSLYLMPHDGHPSARGYRVAARSIAPAVLATPTLAARCLPPAPRA